MSIFNKKKDNKASSDKHYLTSKEIKEIAKANAKVMKDLEKKKYRKCDESEFITSMDDDANILEIEDLHTYFFTDQGIVKAVNGVSFNIPKGSTVGIVGESGCGKTTTGRSIIRLYDITGGSVYYKGERICAGTRSYKDAIKKARKDYAEKKISKEELDKIVEENRAEIKAAQKDHNRWARTNMLFLLEISGALRAKAIQD